MRTTALAALLSASLAATCAWAGTPAEESVRRLAAILQSDAAGLRASSDAPLLSGQLTALIGSLKTLVRENTATAEAVKPVEEAAAALVAEIKRAPKPLGNDFRRGAAGRVQKIAAGARSLLSGAAGPAGGYAPEFTPGFPPPESAALAAFQTRAAAMAAVMERTDLGGGSSAAYQGALGGKTLKAPPRGPKPKAEKAPRYYSGRESDFEARSQAATIKNVRTTVYTPFLAKTRKARRMDGPPLDRHGQTVCTLERYVAGVCPYVSVAIDPRLKVPNGTPLLIPEISALAGREVQFRIVDTGSKKMFTGTSHIDVATDSNQYSGFGRRISGGRFTLVLPQGLHPADPSSR